MYIYVFIKFPLGPFNPIAVSGGYGPRPVYPHRPKQILVHQSFCRAKPRHKQPAKEPRAQDKLEESDYVSSSLLLRAI